MYKVLIVEDEMLVRLGIKASIDWAKLGMDVIADVSNGQAAWEVYEMQKPDLILTDIKMPIMDGIKLIEKIREKDSKTKIIILSCLDVFAIVRKALTFGVTDYILKLTMSQDEMESVLKKVQNELLQDNTLNLVNNENSISKENLISDYLFYGIYSENKFAELVTEFNLRIHPKQLVLCMMEIDHYEELQKRFNDEQGRLIRSSVFNVINELLDKYQRGVFFHVKDKYYTFIFSFYDISDFIEAQGILNEILERIKRVMKAYFDTTVTLGISNMQNGFSSLKGMYQDGLNALNYKYFFGSGQSIVLKDIDPEIIKREIKVKLSQLYENINPMNEEDIAKADLGLDSMIDSLEMSKAETQKFLLRLGYISLMLFNLMKEDMSLLAANYEKEILFCDTLDESVEVHKAYLHEILNRMKKTRYSKEIVKVTKYIQDHYNSEISLATIAEYVELSPNYLCSLFKKELKTSLTDYITEYRVEKAKLLLLDTNLKSYEIASKVGFADESYFSRIFKKTTGIRPNEFKKQYIG